MTYSSETPVAGPPGEHWRRIAQLDADDADPLVVDRQRDGGVVVGDLSSAEGHGVVVNVLRELVVGVDCGHLLGERPPQLVDEPLDLVGPEVTELHDCRMAPTGIGLGPSQKVVVGRARISCRSWPQGPRPLVRSLHRVRTDPPRPSLYPLLVRR